MLRALAEGSAAPAAMTDLAKRRLRSRIDRLALALDGDLAAHQRLLLGLHIRRLGEIDRDLAEVEAAIASAMQPFAAQQALLVIIPGVDALTAAAIVAEIGAGMSVFGTAQHLAAWAGLCPANHENAGKQKRRGTRKGNPCLKAMLVGTAISASRTKGSYLRDKFHRLRVRMGAKKAAVAVAQDPGRRLPHASTQRRLRRSRRRRPRPRRQAPHRQAPGPPPVVESWLPSAAMAENEGFASFRWPSI